MEPQHCRCPGCGQCDAAAQLATGQAIVVPIDRASWDAMVDRAIGKAIRNHTDRAQRTIRTRAERELKRALNRPLDWEPTT